MTWTGKFHFGKDWAAYRGATADNALHAHAAVQLCIGLNRPIALTDRFGRAHHGPALYVRSCIPHRLAPTDSLLILLVEPHSELGRALLSLLPADDIGVCPLNVTSMIDQNAPLGRCLRLSDQEAPVRDEDLDPRLAKSLARLISTAHAPN
jgi:hypothetical protein